MTVVQRPRLVRILELDPDLALRLEDEEQAAATRQVVGTLEVVEPGPWHPRDAHAGKCLFGGLVLDGLIVRELRLDETASSELLGSGDIILPADSDDPVPFVPSEAAWTALSTTRIAWLDAPFAVAVRRWPALAAAMLERAQRRADRLATTQAIAQLTRVDDRVLALLWHLSERWGRVTPDGVVLPVRLTHRAIASLVGARRPSVTTAISTLERDGRIVRREDGTWLLHGMAPEAAENAKRHRSAWDEGRMAPAALLSALCDEQLRQHVTVASFANLRGQLAAQTAIERARSLKSASVELREAARRTRERRRD
jgi:CRP-like cAMP-binding protein